MALEAHLHSLTQRHRDIDAALSSELKRPHADDQKVQELKRLKLQIKDQIATLSHNGHLSTDRPPDRMRMS